MIHKRKRNILVITPVPTHPQNAGNRTRMYAMLEELQEIGYAVHVLYDGSEIFSKHVKKKHDVRAMKKKWDSVFYVPNIFSARLWRKIFESNSKLSKTFFQILLFFVNFFPERRLNSKKEFIQGGIDSVYNDRTDYMVRMLEENLNFQVVLAEYVFMSKALEVFDKSVRKIIDTHDVFSERRYKYSAEGLKDFSFSTTAYEEGKGLSRADVVIAIQDNEKKYLETVTNSLVMTIGHIVPVYEKVVKVRNKTVLFVGTANSSNIHAINKFIKEIWTDIIYNIPDAKLMIAGKVAKHAQRGKGIIRLGEIDNIDEVYDSARIVINPATIGTGLKIKNIEALGFGKPVITSSHSAIGIEHMSGAIVVPHTKEEWVNFISQLLLDEDLTDKMSERALRFVRDNNKLTHMMIRRVFGGYLPNYELRMAPSKRKTSNNHFLIFTWPECGETTLSKVLEEHPDIKIKDEPFNHKTGERILPSSVDRLDSHMRSIRKDYEGTKHNWGLTFEQNMRLLSSGDSVVFLTRQNALQRAVSELISKKIKDNESVKKNIKHLDINEVKELVHKYVWEVGQYKKFLEKQGILYYDLTYEDLYGSNVSHKKKISFIKELLDFVGKDSNVFETNNKIRNLLNSGINKTNLEEEYRTVSNIEDIEEILGSDDFGWLFED